MVVPMNLGQLTEQVHIQAVSGSTGAGTRGQSQGSWSTVETVQASVRAIGGNERTFGREIVAVATHEVGMHYTANATERRRLLWGTRPLHIEAIDNVEERNLWLHLACREVKS